MLGEGVGEGCVADRATGTPTHCLKLCRSQGSSTSHYEATLIVGGEGGESGKTQACKIVRAQRSQVKL